MANNFYNHGSVPQNGTPGDAQEIGAEFNSVQGGFDKMPVITGNGGKTVRVNTGGTALDVSKVTITEPATSATLTIADGATLTATASASVSGTHTGSSSGTNTGDETGASVAALINAAPSKVTPVDADELPLSDSAAAFGLAKLTWANLKTAVSVGLTFLQAGVGAVVRTMLAKLQERVSVGDFGAVGDGVTDDTVAIQAAVTYVQSVGGKLVFDGSKTYLLSRQGGILSYDGVNQSYYAVLITAPIDIDLCGASFTVPQDEAGYCTAFLCNATTRVSISDGYFVGTGVKTAKHLYNGAAVAMKSCTSSRIRDIRSLSMRAGAQLYSCTDCRIDKCISEQDTTYYAFSGTHFGCYSGSENVIESCTTYVSCGDGDIFLYGSGNRNKIINCQAYNYVKGDATRTLIFNIAQGMGADSGQRHATLQGNTVYGMYYGIDVKNDSNYTKVVGNTAICCKAGIVARLGESPGRSYGVVIADNIINTMTGMTQFTYGSEVTFGALSIKTCGIYLQNSIGHTVTGNNISVMGDTSTVAGFRNDFVGIHYQFDGAVDDSVQKGSVISGNIISHQTTIGANNYYSYGPCLYVVPGVTTTNALRGLVVNGNKFDPIFGTGAVENCVYLSYVNELSFVGNSFSQFRLFSLLVLNVCNRATVSGNSAASFRQFVSATSCLNLNIVGNTLAANSSTSFGGTLPTISLDTCTYVSINGNVMGDATSGDGRFAESVTSNWIAMTNNVVASANYSSANYYSFDASAVNTVVGNNLVN